MDQISDMLTQIRNGQAVHQETVELPHSKLKEEVARLLKEAGYLESVRVFKPEGRHFKRLVLKLRYIGEEPAISYLQRVSRPGQRVYMGKSGFTRFLGGARSAVIVSTSRGLLTAREAMAKSLGGEVLCVVW